MTDPNERLARIYAAVGGLSESDLKRFPPLIVIPGEHYHISFRGDMSDSELANTLHLAIYNVAHLYDHLRGWAKANGHDPADVERAKHGSLELRILIDLSNSDKHGGTKPPVQQHSKLSPRLGRIERALQLQPPKGGLAPGQAVEVTFGPQGAVASDSGTARVVISADVRDASGKLLGDLNDMLSTGVAAWEALLQSWGVEIPA
jgi:hypothetical protein